MTIMNTANIEINAAVGSVLHSVSSCLIMMQRIVRFANPIKSTTRSFREQKSTRSCTFIVHRFARFIFPTAFIFATATDPHVLHIWKFSSEKMRRCTCQMWATKNRAQRQRPLNALPLSRTRAKICVGRCFPPQSSPFPSSVRHGGSATSTTGSFRCNLERCPRMYRRVPIRKSPSLPNASLTGAFVRGERA